MGTKIHEKSQLNAGFFHFSRFVSLASTSRVPGPAKSPMLAGLLLFVDAHESFSLMFPCVRMHIFCDVKIF
ncbi:hypothetical protein [Paraburkholderia eburnea]|uniref:hypothetical protein n=1 Tax=Paraburkholderia eburnea TaxID=1189126 RepID=UPI0011AFD8FB|nr:hypothetical protein [Paraburkholderia eburnea]